MHRYNVCLLGNPGAPCFCFDIPENATVADLQKVIHASDWWNILLFKCGDLQVEPEEDLFGRASIWICEHYNNNKMMTPIRPLQQYFPTGPAAKSDGKVDIIAMTNNEFGNPVDSHTDIDASRVDVFNIRKDGEAVRWHLVDNQNNYQVRVNELPQHIKVVVESPRYIADDAINTAYHQLVTAATSPSASNAPRVIAKLFSTDPTVTVAPYSPFEMLHFLSALQWVAHRERSSAGHNLTASDPYTIGEAYDVVFANFERYWCAEVESDDEYCRVDRPLPFPLVALLTEVPADHPADAPLPSAIPCWYGPKPDVAFYKRGFPRFLVEFDSLSNQDDYYQLHVQMACVLGLAVACQRKANKTDNNFFLMGAYFTRQRNIHRLFAYYDENEQICFHERLFSMRSAEELTTFLFEFYNYARYVEAEGEEVAENVVKYRPTLYTHVEFRGYLHTHTSKRPRNGSGPYDDRANAGRGPANADGDHADADGDGTKRAVVMRALQEGHYQVETEEFEPLTPDHVVLTKAPNGKLIIAKLPRKNSDELSLLRELSSQKSPHNHVIPLLDAIPSTLGQVIILPEATRLSTYTITYRLKNKFVQLSHELVEGIAFLHRHKIAHLDIKPDNLVFDFESMHLYIIDFDIAMRCKDVEEMVAMSCGTPGWIAPEIVYDDNEPLRAFSPIRADLWACGNVLLHFANETNGKDRVITLLANLLMGKEPRRRPLLHELVDENPDFWTSGRLSQALESRVRVDNVVGATLEGLGEQKRDCVDDNDGPATKKARREALAETSNVSSDDVDMS